LVLTVIVPAAPSNGAEAIELFTVTWHFTSVGDVLLIDRDPQPPARNATHATTSAPHRAGMDERCGRARIKERSSTVQVLCRLHSVEQSPVTANRLDREPAQTTIEVAEMWWEFQGSLIPESAVAAEDAIALSRR
jgi:hypothetical protein